MPAGGTQSARAGHGWRNHVTDDRTSNVRTRRPHPRTARPRAGSVVPPKHWPVAVGWSARNASAAARREPKLQFRGEVNPGVENWAWCARKFGISELPLACVAGAVAAFDLCCAGTADIV